MRDTWYGAFTAHHARGAQKPRMDARHIQHHAKTNSREARASDRWLGPVSQPNGSCLYSTPWCLYSTWCASEVVLCTWCTKTTCMVAGTTRQRRARRKVPGATRQRRARRDACAAWSPAGSRAITVMAAGRHAARSSVGASAPVSAALVAHPTVPVALPAPLCSVPPTSLPAMPVAPPTLTTHPNQGGWANSRVGKQGRRCLPPCGAALAR